MQINSAIADRMKATGQSYEQVMAELEMMKAAKRRFETGKLTAEDRRRTDLHALSAAGATIEHLRWRYDSAGNLASVQDLRAGAPDAVANLSDVIIRPAYAEHVGPDVYVSIHANASRSPEARGTETYYLARASDRAARARRGGAPPRPRSHTR